MYLSALRRIAAIEYWDCLVVSLKEGKGVGTYIKGKQRGCGQDGEIVSRESESLTIESSFNKMSSPITCALIENVKPLRINTINTYLIFKACRTVISAYNKVYTPYNKWQGKYLPHIEYMTRFK